MGSAYNYCLRALENLPHCADVTRKYCQRYSGIFLVDGKFIKVKKYDRKIPVIYGIDYQTHDIPTYILSKAENYQTCSKFFNSLKLLDFPILALICDDNINIYQTFQRYYPMATVQLCLNHYKESLRKRLSVRTDPTYIKFMREIELLLSQKRSLEDFNQRARVIVLKHQGNQTCVNIMLDIERRKPLLLGYLNQKRTPLTTNLIECFNSHLQGRLKTIKGFESFKHAKLWLNGYFLRRRTKKFTDCSGKFRRLNGKTSLSQAKKPGIDLPTFF